MSSHVQMISEGLHEVRQTGIFSPHNRSVSKLLTPILLAHPLIIELIYQIGGDETKDLHPERSYLQIAYLTAAISSLILSPQDLQAYENARALNKDNYPLLIPACFVSALTHSAHSWPLKVSHHLFLHFTVLPLSYFSVATVGNVAQSCLSCLRGVDLKELENAF